jgi:hypothetical protein
MAIAPHSRRPAATTRAPFPHWLDAHYGRPRGVCRGLLTTGIIATILTTLHQLLHAVVADALDQHQVAAVLVRCRGILLGDTVPPLPPMKRSKVGDSSSNAHAVALSSDAMMAPSHGDRGVPTRDTADDAGADGCVPRPRDLAHLRPDLLRKVKARVPVKQLGGKVFPVPPGPVRIQRRGGISR